MSVDLQDEPMAKAKGRPKKPGGEGTIVRVESDIVTMAKYLAAQRGIPMSKLISDFLRPTVEREFRKVGKKIMDDTTD